MEQMNVKVEMLSLYDLSSEIQYEITTYPEKVCKSNGSLYFLRGETVFCCEDSPAGNQFAFSILYDYASGAHKPYSPERAYYLKLLTNTCSDSDCDTPARHRIQIPESCMVILFQSDCFPEKDFISLFTSIAPIDSKDIPVAIDYSHVALVKNLQYCSEAEAFEYASAVIGSMEGEGISGVRAGLGTKISRMEELHISYEQAKTALRLGKRFIHTEAVYQYSQLALERILDCIPEERRAEFATQFSRLYFSDRLNDEIQETVRVFFENDLNLAATSKQLFIHRNTLNYRLDKIKKELGYDLRKFQDAIVYKILSEISE